MNAYVFGGYKAQMRGRWAEALRENCGIEVAHYCCADENYKNMPMALPKGVGVVLVVAGSCSHNVSERAKALAQRVGVRCETVSKDVARTVSWMQERGYVPQIEIAPVVEQNKQEEQVPIVYNPAPVAQEPAPTPAPDPDTTEWLDAQQAKALLPDMYESTFYDLAKEVTQRAPRKERRTRRDAYGKLSTRSVMVWSMDEVVEMERLARLRKLGKNPVSITDPLVSDPPVTFQQVFGKYLTPPLPPVEDEGLDGMLLSLRHCADELAKAAVRERDQWKVKYEQLQAENDALKAQLERIKAALEV
jgi:hypothetical protein